MKRNKPEAEVTARLDCETKVAHICVAEWPRYDKKFTKLYGKPSWRDSEDRSAAWIVPLKCVSFRKLPSTGGKKRRGNPNLGKMRRKKRVTT